jgi:hypothetical protein
MALSTENISFMAGPLPCDTSSIQMKLPTINNFSAGNLFNPSAKKFNAENAEDAEEGWVGLHDQIMKSNVSSIPV